MLRVGILTYFASINYGAFLQAYALQKALENKYGEIANIEIINFDTRISRDKYLNNVNSNKGKSYIKARCQYNKFIASWKKLKLSCDSLVSDNIDEVKEFLEGKFDIIVVGSDEVWKTDSFRGFPTPYWLNFELSGTTYMAYAVSGRNDYQKMKADMKLYIKEAMQRFAYIGARDEITRKELLKIHNMEIFRNCDPTFLNPQLFHVSDEKKKRIKEKYGLNSEKPVVSIMVHNRHLGSRLHRMLNYENQVIYLFNINESVRDCNWIEFSPFEWSDMIAVSDFVITSFFHGTVFSIIHETPFLAVEMSEKGRGKIENLLIENHMSDRMVFLSDFEGNLRLAAIDIYTKLHKEWKTYDYGLAQRAKENEAGKNVAFFKAMDKIVRNKIAGEVTHNECL